MVSDLKNSLNSANQEYSLVTLQEAVEKFSNKLEKANNEKILKKRKILVNCQAYCKNIIWEFLQEKLLNSSDLSDLRNFNYYFFKNILNGYFGIYKKSISFPVVNLDGKIEELYVFIKNLIEQFLEAKSNKSYIDEIEQKNIFKNICENITDNLMVYRAESEKWIEKLVQYNYQEEEFNKLTNILSNLISKCKINDALQNMFIEHTLYLLRFISETKKNEPSDFLFVNLDKIELVLNKILLNNFIEDNNLSSKSKKFTIEQIKSFFNAFEIPLLEDKEINNEINNAKNTNYV